MPRAFVTADLHLGHKRVFELRNQHGGYGWKNVDEMNEAIIGVWNRVVRPSDVVYVLGDVVMQKKCIPLLDQLKGRKFLIAGNHDLDYLKLMKPFFVDILPMKIMGSGVILTHIPIHPGSARRWEGNIHGHLHDKELPWPYLNVGLEKTGLMPILMDKALQLLAKKKNEAAKKNAGMLTEFQRHYLIAALWSSDHNDEQMLNNYDVDAFDPRELEKMTADCTEFLAVNIELVARATRFLQDNPKLLPKDGSSATAMIAHDFWLTRNHHGVGFWDRGYPEDLGEALTKAAQKFKEVNLYVGDDGYVYQEP